MYYKSHKSHLERTGSGSALIKLDLQPLLMYRISTWTRQLYLLCSRFAEQTNDPSWFILITKLETKRRKPILVSYLVLQVQVRLGGQINQQPRHPAPEQGAKDTDKTKYCHSSGSYYSYKSKNVHKIEPKFR